MAHPNGQRGAKPIGASLLVTLLLASSTWFACGDGEGAGDAGQGTDVVLPGLGGNGGAAGGDGGSESGGAGGRRLSGQGGLARVGGASGTAAATGGTAATGGSVIQPATGGITTGGRSGSGGVVASGGVSGSGGVVSAGGRGGAGGGTGMGGIGGVGGAGGRFVTGGRVGSGGGSGTGGGLASGGSPGTGGVQGPDGGQGGGSPVDTGTITTDATGNPEGQCVVPAEAQLEDVSSPTTVVGTGTPESCTGDAFIAAVAKGGVITFACGPDMTTVRLTKPAKVWNDKGPKIVIDGGGKVTLSGEGVTRILYMNTCDERQVWTSSHCDNQETPQLTVQNLVFANGNSKNETEYDGGGAIYASGGRFKVINSRFVNNVCADQGPDVGGGAIRAFQQYQDLPVYVVNSTFGGGEDLGNVCSNGGALSSIGVSWTVLNSVISYNQAIGNGGNPAESGTPGGGSGGGIYNDGNTMTLTLCGTRVEYNKVNAYGSAIFFVSNDHSGNIVIASSTITNNIGGSWYPTYPQISNHDDTPISVTDSTIR
jgi:hypothetical protein